MILHTAYIALGANLGNPQQMLADTVRALEKLHVQAVTTGGDIASTGAVSPGPATDAASNETGGITAGAQRDAGAVGAVGAANAADAAFAVSALYRSAPFQADGPDYYNAAVRLRTDLTPEALLTRLQALENAGGRVRSTLNAPRTLDLDLLLHGQALRNSPELTLPHPRMHERAFVLRPLLDLGAGNLSIPGIGTIARCEALTREQRIERMPSPWV